MVFSTLSFLTVFLPAVLVGCWILLALRGFFLTRGRRFPIFPVNALLLAASAFFYFWGEGWGVAWLLASAAANDVLARVIASRRNDRSRRFALGAGIALNLAFLGYFKYAGFFCRSVNAVFGDLVPVPEIALPLGISFYTFQAMSYLVDVFRRDTAPARTPLDFACYLTLFPQLVAGPIVRYSDVAERLASRRFDIERIASGFRRFICGLAKKTLIANTVAEMADAVWSLADAGHGSSPMMAWLGLLSYALQIYYDFSGYSDMAIGIGRMLGFEFCENFNYPYISGSVREFWRRWHISLSTWFRDYLYIPLGGNRRGAARACVNGLAVFALCGLWHGASWTFLLWGLWHGLFITVERFVPRRERGAAARALGRLYTAAMFLSGWLIFRSETTDSMCVMLRSLAGLAEVSRESRVLWIDVSQFFLFMFLLGAVFACPVAPALRRRLRRFVPAPALSVIENTVLSAVLFACFTRLAGSSYNPFLYFRF